MIELPFSWTNFSQYSELSRIREETSLGRLSGVGGWVAVWVGENHVRH